MRRLTVPLLILATLLYPQDRKRKSKSPDVTIVSVTAHRTEDLIAVDGRVRNTGEKALAGLVLYIDFLDSDRHVLTTLNGPPETQSLAPGEESEFRLQVKAPVRAVRVRFNSQDGQGKELTVGNAGPFSIE